jgi:hypothetical protein
VTWCSALSSFAGIIHHPVAGNRRGYHDGMPEAGVARPAGSLIGALG